MNQAATLTLPEAVSIFETPLTQKQLRAIVSALGWKPAEWRHTGRGGHPHPAYDAEQLMRLHAALLPFRR